jgi:hypothetical protein
MFNLETAIARWREQMLSSGIKAPVPLDELENHLREELARGCGDQKTFDSALEALGNPRLLRSEFKKVERSNMKRKIMIATAILGFFIGTSIIMPALAQHKHRNVAALSAGENFFSAKWSTDEITPLCIGCLITFAAIGTGGYAFKSVPKASAV